ncbi:exonuclease [Ceratobasidium sp. AG-Ba]|nr:exonuclease [Ceratobasidium sp. AG-Ba]
MTYLFVPKTKLYSILDSMEISRPTFPPANFTALMFGKDRPPTNISEADIAITGAWSPNGMTHSIRSVPATRGDDGNGWLQIEILLVRLNQAYAPNGSFSVYAQGDPHFPSPLGYDAAVCIEEFRPYMLNVYNNTAGSPTTLGLLHRGLDFDNPVDNVQSKTIQNGLQWGINSTGKFDAFASAHENSRDIMRRDNGRDFWYVPNPTAVSFTSGEGPQGYTKLDPARVARALVALDYQYMLPYMAGSQPVVARVYPDHTVAYIRVSQKWLALLLFVILLLGYVSAIFVPRLPLGVPRRDFSVFSWVAALQGDDIISIPNGVRRHEHIDELRRRARDVKVCYTSKSKDGSPLLESQELREAP